MLCYVPVDLINFFLFNFIFYCILFDMPVVNFILLFLFNCFILLYLILHANGEFNLIFI